MNVVDFCAVEENAKSIFCYAVDFLGPMPIEFSFMYIVGYFFTFLAMIMIVIAPVIFCFMIAGGVSSWRK